MTDRDNMLNLGYLVLLNICLSQSWNILGGFTGQTSLGHAAFFGIGADCTLSLAFVAIADCGGHDRRGRRRHALRHDHRAPTFRLRGPILPLARWRWGRCSLPLWRRRCPLSTLCRAPKLACTAWPIVIIWPLRWR
ncbi:MAG: hypothetical protein R2911_26875 [Caldilineaceae bacterium]